MTDLPTSKEDLIAKLIHMEWDMFTAVHNTAGRALCQDDKKTFLIMRTSQFMAWNVPTLCRYYCDVYDAKIHQHNLMTDKYGYMMETTHPAEYAAIKNELPAISMEKRQMIYQILRQQRHWLEATAGAYPNILRSGRPIRQSQAAKGDTAFETYTQGELMTYSIDTLNALWAHMQSLKAKGRNLNEEILQYTAKLYGLNGIAEL